jgi:5-methylcytosine-specific restriction endonuclease McrA
MTQRFLRRRPRLSMHGSAPAMRRHRRRKRKELIDFLGGKCRRCGKTKQLEPHHKQPRLWRSREVWSNQRLKKYLQEARAGLLELLCRGCNASEGAPDDGTDF